MQGMHKQIFDNEEQVKYNKSYQRGRTGFDRGLEDGEAIRRQMRQIANLKLNADENYALAA